MQGRSDDQREILDAESVTGHLLKAGSVFGFLAMHRRELFPDEMFRGFVSQRSGPPSVPADVMAAVITLQALHGLSDSETVDAVTFDLRWKTACGMAVTDGGFHATTLTYWRRRLAASDRPNRIFEAVKTVVAATGVLTGKTRRALDSTILDDAVATQDTVTQLIGAIRRVRREVPAPCEVIAAHCTAHDYDDPGKPRIAWNDKAAREQLVDALVGDAHRLLGHLPEAEHGPKAADAVALLALIAGQDVEPVEGSDGTDGRWRIAQSVAPDRVISTVDPEARHAHKTVHRRQDGYKAHIAIEPDTGIITDCALTKASGAGSGDAAVGIALLASEPEPVRDSAAVGWLEAGVHIKAVADMLGTHPSRLPAISRPYVGWHGAGSGRWVERDAWAVSARIAPRRVPYWGLHSVHLVRKNDAHNRGTPSPRDPQIRCRVTEAGLYRAQRDGRARTPRIVGVDEHRRRRDSQEIQALANTSEPGAPIDDDL